MNEPEFDEQECSCEDDYAKEMLAEAIEERTFGDEYQYFPAPKSFRRAGQPE